MYVRDPTFHITHQPFYLGAKHLGIYGYQVTSCEAMRTPRQYISIGPLARLTEIRYVPLRVAVTRCLLYTSPSPRDLSTSRMPSSA